MSAIEIPEGVVDRKSYMKFIALSRNPIIKDHYVETSDGDSIDLHTAPQWIRKYIQHLAPIEQEEIMQKKSEWQRINMKMRAAESAAYGKKYGRVGRPKNDSLEHDIVELLGRMFTIPEVIRIMGEDNEIIVSEEQVRSVLKRRLHEVERKREEFRNKVADVRLYNKRPRLEELAWMYSKMKMRYISFNGVDSYNAMLRTLEQIRKEAEGDQLTINGALDVNVNLEIQNHIQKEILRTINIKEIILGRIAARMGFDTKKLVAGLHNSYYNKFVQISGDFDPNAEIEFPSLVNYDYNEIQRRNNEFDDAIDIEAEEVTDDEKAKADAVREMFLAKIRAQREQAEARTSAYTEYHGSDYSEASDTDLGEKRKIGGRRKKK